ncbi:MAG TPA: HD domain-containing phosphohydrolase [Dehalococcoidia bacterium]|nr:HD domain-containing phosphohydrolase [Dehalococcoidia bacterium]
MVMEKVNVLFVEDNPQDAELVKRMLTQSRRAEFTVDWVENIRNCEEKIYEDSVDIVLLDNRLPGEDGITFLQRLEDIQDLPPIIMMTGAGDERLAALAVRAGAFDYYPKSAITSEVLDLAISQALDRHRMRRHLAGAEEVIFTLAGVVEAKDPLTQNHLQRISRYTVTLGNQLNLSQHELILLRHGGILHDIGKMGVSEAILRKPGALSDSEWKEMKQHPIIGEGICAPLRYSHEVGPIVRHHHERWDGGGYPDGLARDTIPLLARIVSVADAYDAMTSTRPYRAALPNEEAVRRLRDGAGTQWDPDITAAFVGLVESGKLN